ncbi:MAG: amino acid adenylation domain-containing protein [Acetobacteraceae bacterium]
MEAVAVIGMACRLPAARSYDAFWDNLRNARGAVREIPAERWIVPDEEAGDSDLSLLRKARWGGLLDRVDLFDNRFFGISAREARSMDPQQRLLLEETWHCLEDAGIPQDRLRSRLTSVYVGVMTIDYHQNVTSPFVVPDSYACLGNYVGILANRLSNVFGWRGESFALDAACAGSLTALHQARRALLAGECDYALVGGVSLIINPWHYLSFARSRMLSPSGQCRTFDRDANGYVPGEGVSVLLLCREEDARRDGARVHGRVLGTATGHVGASDSITAPSVAAQRRVIQEAARAGDVDLSTISYVEAHGTGTPLGDPIEVAALTEVLTANGPRAQPCWVGSAKTSIGHLEAAAGLAGVTKVLLMMRHRMLVPTLNLDHHNPLIDFQDGPLRPVTACASWPGDRLRAGVSAFGFGGTNAHAILEAPDADDDLPSHDEASLPFVLSAASPDGFRALWDCWRQFVASPDFRALSLRDLLGTLACGRVALAYRFAAVVRDRQELQHLFAQSPAEPTHAPDRPRVLLQVDTADQVAALRRLGVHPVAVVGPVGADAGLARFDPAVRRMVLPWALDATYLAALRDALAPPETAAFERLLARGRDLLVSNFTFRGYLNDWQRALASRGDPASWIKSPPQAPADRLLLTLCLMATCRRLVQRWDLAEPRDVDSEAWTELACLLADGVLQPDESIRLLQGAADLEQLASTAAERALTARLPLAYPLLRRHSAEREGVVAMQTAPADITVDARTLSRIGGLAELWRHGVPVDWTALDASYRPVSLPLYPFQGQRHWIDLRGSADAPLRAVPAHTRADPGADGAAPPELPAATSLPAAAADAETGPLPPPWSDPGESVLDRLDAYAAQVLFVALERAGALTPLGIGMTRAGIADRCLRLPRHGALLDACLDILARHGLVAAEGPLVRAVAERSPVIAAAQHLRAALSADTEAETLAAIIDRCVGALPAILSGDIPAEDVVFPAQAPDAVEHLLALHPDARSCLDLTAEAVAAEVARRLHDHPARVVRIIEYGAGTGNATARVLSELAPYAEQVEYFCTDRSAATLAAATRRVAGSPLTPAFVRLDLTEPPVLGDALGRFDIALAVNALHPLPDIAQALRHLRSRLVRGGVLVMNEPTRSRDALTVTLGLLPAWWPRDPARDQRGALLTEEGWHMALRGAFTGIAASGSSTRSVIVARADDAAEPPAPAHADMLVLIRSSVAQVVDTDIASVADNARFVDLGVDSLAASDLARRLTEALGRPVSQHVIDDHPTPARLAGHLVGLAPAPVAEPPAVCTPPLAPAPAAPPANLRPSPPPAPAIDSGTAVLIRDVIAAVTESDPASLDDNRRFVDLGVDSILAGDAARLLSERLGRPVSPAALNDHPTIAALARYVRTTGPAHDEPPRPIAAMPAGRAIPADDREAADAAAVVPSPRPAPAMPTAPPHPTQVWRVGSPGDLASLAPHDDPRRAPGPGEIEVAVSAASLNFRDVMEALGRLGEPRPLGLEFAGHVTSVGPGVSGFDQGAPVFGLRVGSLARHVIADPSLIAPLPAALTPAQAASLPIVFLTASWTLERIARLGTGQTVLIHAATGGVGLAALQIARLAGATVLATAGSPEKRAHLQALGIACVADSRDVSFADAVRQATGGAGVDVVLNCLAGAMTDASLGLVRPGGIFIEIGKTDIRPAADLARQYPRIRYTVFDLLAELDRDPALVGRRLRALMERFDSGELTPLPVRGFPFAQAAGALRFLARARHIGKVVLTDAPTPVQADPPPPPASVAAPATPTATAPMAAPASEEPIAIIGMAGRFPGASDLGAYWRLLRDGVDAIGTVPPGRWDDREFAALGAAPGPACRAGGFLEDAEGFDAAFFGISPREALLMDPQQRLILEQAWLAMADAGLRPGDAASARTGVFIGASASDYAQKGAILGLPVDRPSLLAQMPSTLSARLGYQFDLKGPALTVDMGCASAVAAIKLAVDALRRGEVDVAVAGAVAVQSTPHLAVMAAQADILAPDGRCRSFSDQANGLGLSEGVGVVVLRRLSDATQRGDTVHAVIRAVAVSQNGATNGISAPSVAAQTRLASQAFAASGVAPDSVSYVEAHGVGTPAGDAAERAALAEVFGTERALPIGSVKSNIGHTLAAAGMAGLLKLVLQLRHGQLAPSLHAATADPGETGLAVNTRLRPWHAVPGSPRRAALNAFAINGSNGFMLIEEAPAVSRPPVSLPGCGALLLLAAPAEAALRQRLSDLADWLDSAPVELADLAAMLNAAPADLPWRAAFVASDLASFRVQLRAAGAGDTPDVCCLGQVREHPPGTQPVFAEMAVRLCQEARALDATAGRTRLLAAGRLFVEGIDVTVPPPPGARRVALPPAHRFQRQRFWPCGEASAGAPEPAGQGTGPADRGRVHPGPASLDRLTAASPLPQGTEDRRLTALRAAASAVLRLPVAAIPDTAVLPRLGLDSLLAFELRTLIARDLGVAPEPAALLADQALATLARALADHAAAAPAALIRPDPANRFEPFPLTDIQLAYWLGRTSGFALGGACHVYWEFAAGPDRDPDRLEAAFNRLIATHDMLRAVVLPDGTQRVLPDVPHYTIARHDWRGDPGTADHLAALRAAMTRETFDPTAWPLFRVAFSRDDAGTRVHLGVDLLIIDVPSLAALLDQWSRLCADPDAPLSPPGITFRDYVLHQKQQESGAAFQDARAYWQAIAPALPPAPNLPDMKPLDARPDWAWTRHRGLLDRDTWSAFQARARSAGVTPVAALVTAFGETLAHWADERRFTLNLTVNDRQSLHPDIATIIGDFTSTVLLGLDLADPAPFAARAGDTGTSLAAHLGHARFTGVRVLQQRGNGGSAVELMPVVFTSMLGYGALSGPLGRLDHGATRTPQVWLDAQVMEDDGALVVTWDAIDALFPDGLLGGMFAAWTAALRHLALDAEAWTTPLGDWLRQQERDRRARRNATSHPVVEGLLHEPLLRQALAHPGRTAVIAPDGTVTYGQLLGQALAVARALGTVAPDHLIAVSIPKGWHQIAAVIGVLLAGGAYLPIEPSLPPARQHHLLARGEAGTVLTIGATAAGWPSGTRVIPVDTLPPLPLPGTLPPRSAAPADLAYVIFTSGSTGEPKGVMIEHRAALNTVLDVNDTYRVGPSDRVLGLSALSFDLSVWDIFGVLGAGGAVVLPDPRSAADPAHLATLIRQHGVTIWNSVPMFVQLFLEAADAPAALSRLRLVMMSGDWIPIGLPPRLRQANPALDVVSMGGATEASIWSIAYRIGDPDPAWTSIPYGYPMRNQRFHVQDEHMEDCPDWIAGELYIAGTGLARGYWRDPVITDARFIHHPVTGERLYRTGDLGRYRDDGVIEFLGRNDNQVKVGGYRIELGEIEAVLMRHTGVRNAAVVVRADAGGHRSLAAFYIADPAAPPAADTLRAHLSATLPAYMLPASFHRLDAMPLNANEKVDRKALAAWQPSDPAATRIDNRMASVAPRADELEAPILAIWRDVLNNPLLPADGKLFEHGAHSFHAVDANARINRTLNVGCTVTDIFEFATVRALAAALAERLGDVRTDVTMVATTAEPPAAIPAVSPIMARAHRRRHFRTSRSA